MKRILVLTTMFIGITICSVAAIPAVPLQTEKAMVEAGEMREEATDSSIRKPSLSSGGLSQITEMMKEIVRKEQKKPTEGIQENYTGQEES